MAESNELKDQKIYQSRMAKSCLDKLFWVDKISSTDSPKTKDLIVDFGCADGTLLRQASHWITNTSLVGYENCKDTLPIGSAEKESEYPEDAKILYQFKWEYVKNSISRAQEAGGLTTAILSSLIHEVYHYGTPQDVEEFWQIIWGLGKETNHKGFDTIVIRDMIPSLTINRPAHPNDIAAVYRKFLNTKELRDFERCWGSISNNRNLIHFLLKYKYTEPNWNREVKEQYMPLHVEDLMAMIPEQYEIIFMEHNVLPYTLRQVRKDFGITIRDNTHLKMILEKRK